MTPLLGLFLEFPFIRFTNWKQELVKEIKNCVSPDDVSIHTLHELEASPRKRREEKSVLDRFHSYASRIGSKADASLEEILMEIKEKFPFIRFTNWKQD